MAAANQTRKFCSKNICCSCRTLHGRTKFIGDNNSTNCRTCAEIYRDNARSVQRIAELEAKAQEARAQEARTQRAQEAEIKRTRDQRAREAEIERKRARQASENRVAEIDARTLEDERKSRRAKEEDERKSRRAKEEDERKSRRAEEAWTREAERKSQRAQEHTRAYDRDYALKQIDLQMAMQETEQDKIKTQRAKWKAEEMASLRDIVKMVRLEDRGAFLPHILQSLGTDEPRGGNSNQARNSNQDGNYFSSRVPMQEQYDLNIMTAVG